jgi:hypothetical protein
MKLIQICLFASTLQLSETFTVPSRNGVLKQRSSISMSTSTSTSTELPDSLEDAAIRAAQATASYMESAGPLARCRVDFDTSVGDETYTLLKSSTEFMQNYVSALCYATIPGLQALRQEEIMRVATARADLKALESEDNADKEREAELVKIIVNDGRLEDFKWEGPVARVYFPDEGNAALARRDWMGEKAKVPPCVEFASCCRTSRAAKGVENDALVFFFCPKASESDSVEEILRKTEENAPNLRLSAFVNPVLVDMGVTGFGLTGRMLRERLIDPLQFTYYLRTLPWGALTREWPKPYSVWLEDEDQEGGYRLIQTLDRLPSNPEVEDIYDLETSGSGGEERQGPGVLDQLGDFVNGMMRL